MGGFTALAGASAVTTFDVRGSQYAIVASVTDNGVLPTRELVTQTYRVAAASCWSL